MHRLANIGSVARLSEEDARDVLRMVRWQHNGGEPICPECGGVEIYVMRCRPIFKCCACQKQFSVTSGTIFASHKILCRDIIFVTALFVSAAKGMSSSQVARSLGVQQKTAWRLTMLLRAAMELAQRAQELSGEVEVDGAYFGGYRYAHPTLRTKGGRRFYIRRGQRRVVVVARQRGGRTVPIVAASEAAAIPELQRVIVPGSTIYVDGAHAWEGLKKLCTLLRIDHRFSFADASVSTNQAESYFSQLRRAHMGTYHGISRGRLLSYACEIAWRQDHRHLTEGQKIAKLLAAVFLLPARQQVEMWRQAA